MQEQAVQQEGRVPINTIPYIRHAIEYYKKRFSIPNLGENKNMIKKLYAVCLLVSDFKKSFSFYTETLGLILNSQDTGYADFKDPDGNIWEVTQ